MNIKFSLKNTISAIDNPSISVFKNELLKVETNYRNKKINFIKGITGSGDLLKYGDDTDSTIDITVVPSEHTHDAAQLPVSVPATPKTIALRDATGKLYSSSASTTKTGYLIADGRDLASLFKLTTSQYVNVQHSQISGGAACANAVLVKSGNNIILQTWWSAYCYYYAYCRCQCCCD